MDKERRIKNSDDLPVDDDVIAHKHHRSNEDSQADDDPGRHKHTDEDDGPDVEAPLHASARDLRPRDRG